MDNQTTKPESAGIEDLIARLRQEGVDEGRAEAERVLAEAEDQARKFLNDAESEAKSRLDAASAEASRLKRAGKEALEIAMRDAVLELKQGLTERFAEHRIRYAGAVAMLDRDQAPERR